MSAQGDDQPGDVPADAPPRFRAQHSLPVAPQNMTLGFSFSYTAQSSDIRASGNSGDLTCSLKADIDEDVTQTFAGAPHAPIT